MTYFMRQPTTLPFAVYSLSPPYPLHVQIHHFMIADCIFLGVPQLEGTMEFASPNKLDAVGDGIPGVIFLFSFAYSHGQLGQCYGALAYYGVLF